MCWSSYGNPSGGLIKFIEFQDKLAVDFYKVSIGAVIKNKQRVVCG